MILSISIVLAGFPVETLAQEELPVPAKIKIEPVEFPELTGFFKPGQLLLRIVVYDKNGKKLNSEDIEKLMKKGKIKCKVFNPLGSKVLEEEGEIPVGRHPKTGEAIVLVNVRPEKGAGRVEAWIEGQPKVRDRMLVSGRGIRPPSSQVKKAPGPDMGSAILIGVLGAGAVALAVGLAAGGLGGGSSSEELCCESGYRICFAWGKTACCPASHPLYGTDGKCYAWGQSHPGVTVMLCRPGRCATPPPGY
jgi:hypothetical protein